MQVACLLTGLLALCVVHVDCTSLHEHASKLHRSLFKDYNRHIDPRTAANQILNVKLGFALVDIVKLDYATNTLHTNLWLRYKWTDLRLKWEPRDYNGLDVLRLEPEQLWIPDVGAYNNMHRPESMIRSSLVYLYSDGSLLWVPQVRFQSRCDLQADRVRHNCTLWFGSWTHDAGVMDVNFYEGEHYADLDDYASGDQWKITKNTARKELGKYPCCKEEYASLYFNLQFECVQQNKPWYNSVSNLLGSKRC